jgi:L-alanine-DL-glutamate epimerase-like enolase superfamily enzyme
VRIVQVETRIVKMPMPDDPLSGTAGLHGNTNPISNDVSAEYQRVSPFRTAFPRKVHTLFVMVVADNGMVGIGECQAPVVPEAPQAIIKHLLAPLLSGRDAMEREVLWDEMYSSMRDRGHLTGFMLDAISALDIALWDLAGKILRISVAQLAGGAFRSKIPVYVSGLAGKTRQERITRALDFVARGFRVIKLFLNDGLAADIDEVAAIRQAVGKDVQLMVDVQWRYDISSAIQFGRALERLGVVWLETPSNPEDIAGHAEICAALDMAVASGECERTRYQFRQWLERRALDIIQPDVGRAGGITECRKIAALAETFNVPCALHCGVGLSPYIAATLHLAASLPNLLFIEYQPTMHALANTLLEQPILCENGFMTLPEGPGLGITFQESLNIFGATARTGEFPQ